MTIPTHEQAMLPVLNVLADGEARHRRVLADIMADHFQLTPDERVKMLPSGKAAVIRSRTGWALSYMKQAGLVRTPRRGWYEITPLGQEWEASVGRPDIQKFAGALQGQRATKGIFITTSSFSRDAEDYAQGIGTRIVLIDGRRLASLMFEHGVGISTRETYVVKNIDGDYFEES